MTNPYVGNEPYQTAWQQGYDQTSQQSSQGQPQTPDFSGWGYDEATTGYIGQVWQEGALAGQEVGNAASSAPSSGGSSAPAPNDGGAPPGGTSADGTIELPTDIAQELAQFDQYYPEIYAASQASDPETYVRDSIGIEEIPSEHDEPVA